MSKTTTTKKSQPTSKGKMNNELPMEPGSNVINNILNYSKALNITKSTIFEHIELVLN